MTRANHTLVTADRAKGVSLLIASADEAECEFVYPDGGFVQMLCMKATDARHLARIIEDAADRGRTTRMELHGQVSEVTAKGGRVIFAQDGRRRVLTADDARDVAWRLEGAANATVI